MGFFSSLFLLIIVNQSPEALACLVTFQEHREGNAPQMRSQRGALLCPEGTFHPTDSTHQCCVLQLAPLLDSALHSRLFVLRIVTKYLVSFVQLRACQRIQLTFAPWCPSLDKHNWQIHTNSKACQQCWAHSGMRDRISSHPEWKIQLLISLGLLLEWSWERTKNLLGDKYLHVQLRSGQGSAALVGSYSIGCCCLPPLPVLLLSASLPLQSVPPRWQFHWEGQQLQVFLVGNVFCHSLSDTEGGCCSVLC